MTCSCGRFVTTTAPRKPPPPEPSIANAMRALAEITGGDFIREGWYSSADFAGGPFPYVEAPLVAAAMNETEYLVPPGGRTLISAQFMVLDEDEEIIFKGFVSLSFATQSDVAWVQAQSTLRQKARIYDNFVIVMLSAQEWPSY